jgi:hypothetical protein
MAHHLVGSTLHNLQFLQWYGETDVQQEDMATFQNEICIHFHPVLFDVTEEVMKKGEPCLKLLIITSGLLARMGVLLGKGTCVGEDAILENSLRYYSVMSITYTQVEAVSGKRILDTIKSCRLTNLVSPRLVHG